MANIDNTNFTREHKYWFEKFSSLLQNAFTILNNNGKSHSENQKAINILEKIKVPYNSEMEDCKRIFLNTNGHNVFNVVAYLSGQVKKIFLNAKIENKKKRRILEVRTGQILGRGRGICKSNILNGGSGCGRGGHSERGRGNDMDHPFNTWNGVDIW